MASRIVRTTKQAVTIHSFKCLGYLTDQPMTWRWAFYTRVTKTEDLIISRFFGRRVKDEELE